MERVEYTWNTTATVLTRYLCDGWACVAEFDGTANTLRRSYVWGLDLSGTRTGAGGVGGLLAVKRVVSGVTETHFTAYDGNGNVAVLYNATDGLNTARNECDPFGNSLRTTPLTKSSHLCSPKGSQPVGRAFGKDSYFQVAVLGFPSRRFSEKFQGEVGHSERNRSQRRGDCRGLRGRALLMLSAQDVVPVVESWA